MAAVDQAAELRRIMAPARPSTRSATRTRVLAVASGKGGVGKTNLTINLAIALARDGKRVVVLDGDLGLANVDVLLGLVPRWTLQHVVSGERSLEEVICPAPGGIWVIPGGSGLEELANLSEERRGVLLDSLARLDGHFDVLLIDVAAGVSEEVSAFLHAAPEILVVTTPEPTAITDAYAVVKLARQGEGDTKFHLVVNQTDDGGEGSQVARKIRTVARQFLGVELNMLGHVPTDTAIPKAVRGQVPLLVAYPNAVASRRIVELARRLTLGWSNVQETESTIISLLNRLAGAAASSVPAGFGVG
jgi:flagellar biosynthesis protein FlhG